jgi:hypothetical protein
LQLKPALCEEGIPQIRQGFWSSQKQTKERRRRRRMAYYDAVKMKDWQISEAAEKNMPTPEEWREKLGLKKDENAIRAGRSFLIMG